ncbi:Zinc transporter 8 [Seminavis robusta]|uniref:Zinc transporter 8 n=1 Tax=Seminavis robusta TaxID=568900 RepID=A0A9N8D530_9STRA|nr:Zinc transporter 8 [Seminavis robusta]|eukprot:Sro3_g001990.1 Zinc transporter 8 (477) ;mRNA; f:16345-17775
MTGTLAVTQDTLDDENVNEKSSLLGEKSEQMQADHDHDHSHSTVEKDHFWHDGVGAKKGDYVLRRLKMAICLCLTFMTVEVIGGYLAGSLAVLSDAAHLLADLASFAVAIVAAYLAARPSTQYHTYGLKRTESLAALFSMTTLAIISIALCMEAVRRIYLYYQFSFKTTSSSSSTQTDSDSDSVDGKLMSAIATIGVLVNVALAAVLGEENHVHMPGASHDHQHDHSHAAATTMHTSTSTGTGTSNHPELRRSSASQVSQVPVQIHANEVPAPHEHTHTHEHEHEGKTTQNVNLQAARLHVLADLAQSIAVLIAGLIIWWKPSWKIVDPIATILFCILVFYSTLGVIRSAVSVLLEQVPPHISWNKIHQDIQNVPHVEDVHDLHIWSISHGVNALSVHLRLAPQTHAQQKQQTTAHAVLAVMHKVEQIARDNGIIHTTVQVQPTIPEERNETQEPDDQDVACVTCVVGDETQSCVV